MRRLVAMALFGCLAAAPAARADVVLTFQDTTPFQLVTMSAGNNFYDPNYAGSIVFTVGAGGAEAGFGPTFRGFCAELFQDTVQGTTPYQLTTVAGLTDVINAPLGPTQSSSKVAYLTELFGRFYANSTTALGAAAFQLAVWEILYDPVASLNITSGNLRLEGDSATAPVATVTQNWLNTLSGDSTQFTNNPTYAGYNLIGFRTEAGQDLIGLQPPPPPSVPAPAGLLLGLFGVGALGVRRWTLARRA